MRVFSHTSAANALSSLQISCSSTLSVMSLYTMVVSVVATIAILYFKIGLMMFSIGSSWPPWLMPHHWFPV